MGFGPNQQFLTVSGTIYALFAQKYSMPTQILTPKRHKPKFKNG
jgi:hypothetical protein